jgi:hypothetical protein
MRVLAAVRARQRFARTDKRSKIPKWIQKYLTDAHVNLSAEEVRRGGQGRGGEGRDRNGKGKGEVADVHLSGM